VEKDIMRVEDNIQQAEEKGDARKVEHLWEKEKQLREKEKQLREDKKQLRERLMTKEEDLRQVRALPGRHTYIHVSFTSVSPILLLC
jgi:cytochrome c556